MPQTADQVEIAPMPVTAVIGIDIAKHTMVLHDSVSQHSWTIDNTYADALQALEPFAGHDLAVCEATGGYERALLEAARTLNLPVHRADPAKAKAFIASHGGHAKTDKADARWLARLGLERGGSLTRWTAPDPDREALTALVRYRQDLLKQRTAAKNRRSAPTSGPVRDLLEAEIAFLDGQIAQLDTRIDTLQTAPALVPIHRVLTQMTGIGAVGASSLIALMPELGQINRRQIASLAGLAPHPRESGRFAGKRRTGGGRHELRPVLFMIALSAARFCPKLNPFYDRLVSQGKPKRVALTAVARKLLVIANAKVRDANLALPQLT
jgi:transposase